MSLVKIGDITESCLGKMLDEKKNKGELEPYLANINVRWGEFDLKNLSQMRFESHEQGRYGLKEGDLVICEGGEPGRCAIWHEEIPNMKIQKALHRVRAKAGLDIRYLYYWMKLAAEIGLIKGYFTETTIKHLPGDKLKEIELDLPDIHTQKQICDVLDVIDKKIRLNQKINDYLEEMAKTIYNYWFVQFDFPDEHGNPYKSSGGKLINSNGYIIPEDWHVGKVKDVISNICTGLNPRDNFILGSGDIKYITVKNLTTNGTLDFSGCDTINESARAIVHARSGIREGDILFASIAPLGRCYLIQSEPVDWDINESVFSIRANDNIATPTFLYLYFMSDAFIKQATSSSTGSIFKGIRINTLLDTEICIPPVSVIQQFEKLIASTMPLKAKYEAEIQELTYLRDWLLPMLMNGQATIEN